MEIYVYVHNILKGDLPTRASGRERSGQSSVHFGEIGSIAGLIQLTDQKVCYHTQLLRSSELVLEMLVPSKDLKKIRLLAS